MQRQPLGGGAIIYTTSEYRYGTDGVLLASFAGVKNKDKVCDMGCGGGIIPLIMCRDNKNADVYAVDIQENACTLCKKAGEENGFANLKVINADIRNLKGVLPFGEFSVVTCNPPYKKTGSGIAPANNARSIARQDAFCTLDDMCLAAKKLLKSGGRLCVCQLPERLTDLMLAMRSSGIEPKKLRLVHQRAGKEPWLVLLEGQKDRASGLKILPPLYIEENGELSQEMLKIYGPYKEGKNNG